MVETPKDTIVFYAVYVRDSGDPIIPWSRLNQGPFNPAGYPNWELGLNTNSTLLPSYIYISEMFAWYNFAVFEINLS